MTTALSKTGRLVPLLAVAALSLGAAAARAQDISIVAPRHEETIHDNSGNLIVDVRANIRPGQYILIVLDGEPVAGPALQTTFELEGVERGSHQMEALLVDEQDRIYATSRTITFHMWQASAQFPSARQRPVRPPPPGPTPPPVRTPERNPAPMAPPKR